jgi:Flp pilus assembly protein TadG
MCSAPISIVTIPPERANQVAAVLSGFLDKLSRRDRNPFTFGTHLRGSRSHRTRGAELIEFTLNFLPFMIMIIELVDTAWAIFAQATLQQAVRMAVRNGVTLTTAQVTTNLTDTVKANVQAHSVGLLKGNTGLSYIKVHYFDANNPSNDVSNQSWGNTAGNIMRVSVEGYPLNPLMARFWSWKSAVDKSPMSMTVYAADVIEPMSTSVTPAIGPAP